MIFNNSYKILKLVSGILCKFPKLKMKQNKVFFQQRGALIFHKLSSKNIQLEILMLTKFYHNLRIEENSMKKNDYNI